MRFMTAFIASALAFVSAISVHAQELPSPNTACINIYHNETSAPPGPKQTGPINAIMLANLLGHWPNYELRVRPIKNFKKQDLEACKATFFLSVSPDPDLPEKFLDQFFKTKRAIAWIGFGVDKLNSTKFENTFGHRVSGRVSLDNPDEENPAFYQYVSYKDSLFRKSLDVTESGTFGAFEAVRFLPARANAREKVLADLIHNKTYHSNPYFLRSGNKFVVGDIPFSYMHESDRYFAFADLIFDIIDERPVRKTALAFARIEDIHANYELPLLSAAISTLQSEDVPVSIAHIPLFKDPFNAYGAGKFEKPQPATEVKEFVQLVNKLKSDKRNAIIWHGVTHQLGEHKNPHTGTSGDDYEFWDMVANKNVPNESAQQTLSRLESALPIFKAYDIEPRFWVTPHYHASALNNQVFADVFPWQVGRITYYASSFGATFTIPAVGREYSTTMKSLSRARIDELKRKSWEKVDKRSEEPLTQMFPYEIYRDVYGQRIIPETLNYLSYATSEQTAFVRTADDMLADARRNIVIRDYWASFFFHPYIFSSRSDGGTGRFSGDTLELRKLVIGLKLLGYQFTSLDEFERSLSPVNAERADIGSNVAK